MATSIRNRVLLFFSYFILNKMEFHRILQQILTSRCNVNKIREVRIKVAEIRIFYLFSSTN